MFIIYLELNNMKKHIVFLTGAGMSVESGLSTFRGKNGMWNNLAWEFCGSVEGMTMNPARFLSFFNEQRKKLRKVKPNVAHLKIAKLEKVCKVTVITQNIDNLHERAGSANVVHLHGELTKVCSTDHRNDPQYIREYPLRRSIKLGDDAGDGSQLRPYVVLFGEAVENMKLAEDIVAHADIFVVIGTSLVIYPAAGLIDCAKKEIPKYIIDPDELDESKIKGYDHIQTTATEGMNILYSKLIELLV